MTNGADEDSDERQICNTCVGEDYLRNEIERGGADDECSYCSSSGKTISLDDLATRVAQALDDHFQYVLPEPEGVDLLLAKEGVWERGGEPVTDVIAQLAEIPDEAAEHVRAILAEREDEHWDESMIGVEGLFDDEAQYEEGPVNDYDLQEQWAYFQRSLQTESRLFNREAYATLDSIFDGLAGHQSWEGHPVIVEAGPGNDLRILHRARVFQSPASLRAAITRPDLELGPPPPSAAVAGRMNAHGISVFYGATDPQVALAETRPPVGSRALVGSFEIARALQLLDIETLSRIRVAGSYFDSDFRRALEKAKFLESLRDRIAEPVLPDDAPFEYLVTQAIAEYLAARRDPTIDGIIYPSVQSGNAKNVVLFRKAARVGELDIPKGTDFYAPLTISTEDGAEPDYSVSEEVPGDEADIEETQPRWFYPEDFMGLNAIKDTREVTLNLIVGSVAVHHVEKVEFTTHAFAVSRYRRDKPMLVKIPPQDDIEDLL